MADDRSDWVAKLAKAGDTMTDVVGQFTQATKPKENSCP